MGRHSCVAFLLACLLVCYQVHMNAYRSSKSQMSLELFNGTQKPKSRALIIAFTYEGTRDQLSSNFDVGAMYSMLLGKGFHPGDIRVFSDYSGNIEYADGKYVPFAKYDDTSLDIDRILSKFSKSLKPGDFGVLYYAGHAIRIEDESDEQEGGGDELDGYDEAIVLPSMQPYKDDHLYKHLASISAGVTVTVIADACHSEGLSDLPFNYHWTHMKKGGHSWCTDWRKTNDILPLARIRFISSAQAHQKCLDSGHGGFATQFITGHKISNARGWQNTLLMTLAEKAVTVGLMQKELKTYLEEPTLKSFMVQLMETVDELVGESVQKGTFHAWPTMADDSLFYPFDPPDYASSIDGHKPDDNPFVGGRRAKTLAMVAAPPCSHGHSKVLQQKEEQFVTDEHLADASRHRQLGDKVQGWFRAFQLRFPKRTPCEDTGCIMLREPDVVHDVDGDIFPNLLIGDVIDFKQSSYVDKHGQRKIADFKRWPGVLRKGLEANLHVAGTYREFPVA
eukprot:TRINITY_DN32797_c0_g1_i1.p1 TRINITY_DN32797_c0_g1~~TRINITY_DN32797_c0_g1_i1.p1  ORF type:complete len:507 (+),score=19.88 TRINITY_DN32797_c0_g1_i1:27-1547(+)